jgi:hypothetical protein
MLKIVVFGPRSIDTVKDPYAIKKIMKRIENYISTLDMPVTIITSKFTSGWDMAARLTTRDMVHVDLWTLEAYWKTYTPPKGKKNPAGVIRNELMAIECDHGVTGKECGNTPGTANMIKQLKKLDKKVVRI